MAVDIICAYEDLIGFDIMRTFYLDFSISMESGYNNFELRTPIENNILQKGDFVYVPNEEYGGIIDTVRVQTKTDTIYYSGRTWRGLLETKIIEPPSGSDYYTVSGDIQDIVDQIITECGITQFSFEETTVQKTIASYNFERYIDVYTGLVKLLRENDLKLSFRMSEADSKCVISVLDIKDFSDEEEFSSDMYNMDITQVGGTVNHLIGLGAGELQERLVLHLYADVDGVISDTQTLFGIDEITAVYDSSEDDITKLRENMINRFTSLMQSDTIKITLNDIEADVGDKFMAVDEYTGIKAVQYVTQKIIVIKDDDISYQYVAK